KKVELQADAIAAAAAPAPEPITVTASAPAILEASVIASPEVAPLPAPAAEAPAAAMAPPPPPARVADAGALSALGSIASTASRELIQSAKAADLSFAPPAALFGISVDRRVFDRIKSAIEHGERPDS